MESSREKVGMAKIAARKARHISPSLPDKLSNPAAAYVYTLIL